MIVTLKRRVLPEDPSIQWIKEEVPLGREYEVIGFYRQLCCHDLITGKHQHLDCYLVTGHGSTGYMPVALFSDDGESNG